MCVYMYIIIFVLKAEGWGGGGNVDNFFFWLVIRRANTS